MVEVPKYLEKIVPFFNDGIDFTQIQKPTEILDLPIASLKQWDSQWTPFFEELELTSIKDLAQYKEPLMVEGLDPDETNKLAMYAEMIFWKITQIAEHGEQKKKIVLFGLGNAGKTSALTALSEKYSGLKTLLPTRGLIRQSTTIFGYEVMSFDMGGQEDYRNTYFEKADMYFTSSDLMLFCIDIQDIDKYEEALNYFQQIVETYAKYDLYPPIEVVFTKLDPDLANDEELNKNRIGLIEKIEKICQKCDVGYVNSSIFDRNSIEYLFSLALKRISTSGGVIQELLSQFAKDIDARACTLISSSGLVFGSFGATHQEEEMLNNSAAYLQNLYLFHVSEGLQKEDFYMMEYKRNNLKFIAEYITENESGMVYLWILTSELRAEVLGIQKFKEELMPLIKVFI